MSDKKSRPVFDPTDLSGNALKLVNYFHFKDEADVSVTSFTIEMLDGEKINEVVRVGKYKSALFLLYLYDFSEIKDHSNQFVMDDLFRYMVWQYFGDEICQDAQDAQDAIENLETKHTTVRALLKEGAVISLALEPSH